MNNQEKHKKEIKEMVQLRRDLNLDERLKKEYTSGRGFTPLETKKIYEQMGKNYNKESKTRIQEYVDDVLGKESNPLDKYSSSKPFNIEDLVEESESKVKFKFNEFGEIIGLFSLSCLIIIGVFFFNNSTGYSVFSLNNSISNNLIFFFILLVILFVIYFTVRHFIKRRNKNERENKNFRNK